MLRRDPEMRLPTRRRTAGKEEEANAEVRAVHHNLVGRMEQQQLETQRPWLLIPEEQWVVCRQAAADQWVDWAKCGAAAVLTLLRCRSRCTGRYRPAASCPRGLPTRTRARVNGRPPTPTRR